MMRQGIMGLLALGLMAGAIDAVRAADEGPRGRNARLFVVPAPEEITIDGRLDDWDTSAGIESYVAQATYDQRRVVTHAMYDDEAFYIGARVWDPTPMMNRHDPEANADKAWDADAFQFRMYLEPRFPGDESQYDKPKQVHHKLAHLLLWYYTDRQEPNLHVQYSMAYAPPKQDWPNEVAPRDAFDAAYREWDGGDGYTMEYRIPWDTLSETHRPRAGDVTAASLQVQWGRADGLKTLGGEGWVVDLLREPGFPFQSSACWGKAIFTKRGDLPQAASAGSGGSAGESAPPPTPLELSFDLPGAGNVSLGLYDRDNVLRRQVLAEAKRKAGTVTEQWTGLDDDGEPLAPGTYTMRGIVSDPITTEFILSVHNSGDPPYKTDDNTGGWGGDHGTPTTIAAAGENLLLAWSAAESGWGVIRTDRDGKKQWGAKHSATYLAVDEAAQRYFVAGGHGFASHKGVRMRDVADSRPLSFSASGEIAEMPEGAEKDSGAVTGLAAGGGRIYTSYGERDLIAVNDRDSGALLETWSIEAPGRVALDGDGALLAISADRIVRLEDGEATPFLDDHLDEPMGLALDAQGRVYVTNQGELHNVSVFSPRGEYVRSIGTTGGRARVGRFEPEGMLAPGGCAIDTEGRLWVAETLDSPKRISVWNVETGELVNEFFGGSSYFGWAWMDPDKPGEVYCHNVLWNVDLNERTKRIHSTIWRQTDPDMIRAPRPGGFSGHFRVITADNGRQFGWAMTGSARGHVLFMREGDIFKPIAGVIGPWQDEYPALEQYLEQLEAQWDEQEVRPHDRPRALFWQDANDDARVQVDEVTPMSPPRRRKGSSYFNWIGSDLTVWNEAGTMFEPVRFDGDRPIYNFNQPVDTGLTAHNHNTGGIWFDDRHNDGVYLLTPGGDPTLTKRTLDGEIIWSTGKRLRWNSALSKPAMRPGDLWGLTMPLGLAGDFTGVASYFNPYHIFTRDGLYVAMLMRAGKAGGGLGADITASETLTGQLVKPAGMDRYFLLAGDQDGRITEVHGLDTVQRLGERSVTITPEDFQRVTEAHRTHEAAQQRSGALFLQRYKSSLDTDNGEIRQRLDDRRSFRAQLAHDGERLYVRYHVQSSAPLVNSIDDPQLIFTGGNLIDVQLGTDAHADPQREAPAAGDVRLLIGRRDNDEPIAVLYRPTRENAGEPIVLKSPTGEEAFSAIDVLEDVELEREASDDGFTVTASVPLAALEWQPAAGQAITGDVGYIFGNATGTRAEARRYWRNNSFTANVTDDIPHESRIEPNQWGTVIVE